MFQKIINFVLKAFIVFFIILTFVFIYLSIFDKQVILNGMEWIKQIVAKLGYWNYLIIFVFGFIESFPLVGISVPGQTVLLTIAGFLGYQHMYLAIFSAAMGALLGNFTGYLLGVKYGDYFFEKYGKFIGVTKTDVKYVKKGIEKHGWLLVILGKFHNMFRAFVPFIAGSGNMKVKHFTLFNIIGSVLRAVVMVLLGVFFVQNAETILNNIGKVLLVLVLGLVAYVYFFKKEEFMKYLEEKQKELEITK